MELSSSAKRPHRPAAHPSHRYTDPDHPGLSSLIEACGDLDSYSDESISTCLHELSVVASDQSNPLHS